MSATATATPAGSAAAASTANSAGFSLVRSSSESASFLGLVLGPVLVVCLFGVVGAGVLL